MEFDKDVFRRQLRRIRRSRDLTQEELSKLAGLSENSVARYEMGKTIPRIDKVYALAVVLGVTVDELIMATEAGETAYAHISLCKH